MADIIAPSGIASTLAFGTPKMVAKVTGSGVASTKAFGTPRVAPRSALQSAPGEPTASVLTNAADSPQLAVLATTSGPATAT
jgi:hypothetical protein